jgi:excisionase family DNA binding protein
VLTVKELAKRLRISRSKAYLLLEAGKVPHYRIDGTYRVSEEQLREYLESVAVGGNQPKPAAPAPRQIKLKHLEG